MADLVLEQCPPSARAVEIQALFDRAGQPGFAAVYARAYRVRERSGMKSWIGVEERRAVLHISVTPEPFSDGTTTLTGGFLGDLMADETHRQFWHPLKLVRRMVADVRKERIADFLLTSYVPAAEAVFKAAGFRPFASIQRHVMPLAWPYPMLRRLMHREPVPRLAAVPFGDPRVPPLLREMRCPGVFRAEPTEEHFATRMPRMEYPAGTWLLAGPIERHAAMVLTSRRSRDELVIADVVWRDTDVAIAGVLSAVARWGAREGHRRVYLTTIPGSRLAVAARRAGFLERPEPATLMILSLATPDRIPAPSSWSLTPFALTGW